MNNVAKHISHLPTKLGDLTKFVLIYPEKLKVINAELKAMDKLGIRDWRYKQRMEEAQILAGDILDAQADLGQELKKIPKASGNYSKNTHRGNFTLKEETVKELGFSNKQVSQFQILDDNRNIIEQVKAEARENEDLPTRTEVLRRIRGVENEKGREEKREELKSIELKTGKKKYRIIYADPPWMYDKGKALSDKYGDVQKHYPPMETEKICGLPVSDLCQDDCVLFLWATAPKLPEALEVMKAWGFQYKTNIVWDKVKHNFGYYFSVRHELLLIGGKGSSVPDVKELHDSVITIERSDKHSEKPEYFRGLIDKLYITGNRVELFARDFKILSEVSKLRCWKAWGNES